MDILKIADRLPESQVDVIYVPGYCLERKGQRLAALGHACMVKAVLLMQQGQARYLVYSGCYNGEIMERELTLRRELAAHDGGINSNFIHEIRGITDTNDELIKLGSVLKSLDVKSILFVANEYHTRRLVRWALARLPGIALYHTSVKAPVYEFTDEAGNYIKTIRSGVKPLWIGWNVLLYYATPLVMRVPSARWPMRGQ